MQVGGLGQGIRITSPRPRLAAAQLVPVPVTVAEPFITPEDRIGALELQNLSVLDNRAQLLHHLASVRRLHASTSDDLDRLLGQGDDD